MKELSIEWKGKRYDEAIERAKGVIEQNPLMEYLKKGVEYIFPELAESKDERIRKVIYGWICTQPSQFFDSGFSKEEMLAWLKKQGKNNTGISEATKKELEDNLSKALEKETPESWNKFIEKQAEQKPAWSEEDERIYQSIMDDTVQENQLNDKQTNWLRDIKYRYFPQPKQQWSEEDEKMLDEFIKYCELSIAYNGKDSEYAKTWEKRKSWLKFIKDRYT